MLDGSSTVPPTACVGKSLGSSVDGGGAAGAGDGGFTEIGVASMAERGGCAHTRVRVNWEGGGSPLLDCEIGPALGPPLWGLLLVFWGFGVNIY